MSKRLDQWANQVSGVAKTTLVVQLDPPDRGDAWFLSVLGRGAEGGLLPIEQALTDSKRTQHLADEIVRLERLYDKLGRAGGLRRGQVYLSQDEAWELMTVTGPALEAAGFDVRVPALSRRKPTPVAAAVRGARRRDRSSAPTSSATCAGRRCSTTSSSPPPTSPGWPPRPGRSCARTASGSSSTGST